jgi:ribosomal protein S18 acetylase RimI-like enzyme
MSVVAAPVARRATPADVPTLARVLARAYDDDPVAIWTCRSDALRPAVLEGLYRASLAQALLDGEVWVTPELSSAAVWVPPGNGGPTLAHKLARVRALLHPRLLPHLVPRLPLMALGARTMGRAHPRGRPHWYLSLLATDPPARGRGLGAAMLRPVFERCDADGVGIYLESSKERNISFYARHGFRVTGEVRLPRGPRMWLMWRESSGGT